jgi:VIT1/CCC1 family predicted Fe2+/Mn2+ transporter
MTNLNVPESDLLEITERTIKAVQRDPEDNSRYLACRWLKRLFYDVRKWNLGFIDFLKTYPGFRKSRDPKEYHRFFRGLAKYKASLDDRYGEAKGDLCANLKMLAARYTLDFQWLYDADQAKYNELYQLVKNAYASEESILETATTVVYDVIAKENVRYASDLEREIDETAFLAWHTDNHLAVVQTILDYEKRSAEAVKRLNEIAERAGFRFLTIAEYAAGLSDPLNHPDTMFMGEPIITERKIMSSNKPSHETARLNTVLAYCFGALFVIGILALVVFIPNPTRTQYHFFAVVLALAAGGIATVMTGMIDVRASFGKKLAIGATGALAVFVIVFFFLPAMTGD